MSSVVMRRAAVAGLVVGLTVLGSTPHAQRPLPAKPDESRFTPVVLVPHGELDEPMMISILADERVLIIERKGGFKVYDPSTNSTSLIATLPVNTKYFSASGRVTEAEEGIFGLTVDPNFAQNRWVYMRYSDPQIAKWVLARWELRDVKTLEGQTKLTLVDSSKKIMLEHKSQRERCCHTGGGMAWDKDGNLYITVGNNAGGDQGGDERPGQENNDSQGTAGNTNDLRGKILRIHPEPDGTYTIPAGNLFPPGMPGTRPEIFGMGVRNPWRISIDSRTGYAYWGEVGPGGAAPYDEYNQARRAGNFGFPFFVGENESAPWRNPETGAIWGPFDPQKPINTSVNNTGLRELPPAVPSFIGYPYATSDKFPELGSGAHSAVGGPFFHRGDFKQDAKRIWPAYYENKWLMAEFERGLIMSVTVNEESDYVGMEQFLPSYRPLQPIDLSFGPEGDLYVLDYGSVWFAKSPDSSLVKIEYNAGNRKPRATAATNVRGGAVPLQVELSAAGTSDPDGDRLRYVWRVTSPGGSARTYNAENPRVSFGQPGVYTATLTVTDSAGANDTSSVEIIAGNTPPQIELSAAGVNQTFVRPGEPFRYSVTVTDREDRDVARDRVAVSIDTVTDGMDLSSLERESNPVDVTTRFGVAKALIARSDCTGCHTRDTPSVGPTYVMLASKYRPDSTTLGVLANKVKQGGSKVWGEAEMPPHPNLATSEIRTMVEYFLNAGNAAISTLPLAGSHAPELPDGRGRVLVRAVYTDRPVGNLPAQTSVAMKLLRGPVLNPAAADVFAGVTFGARTSRAGAETRGLAITAMRNGHVGFRQIDLTGIRSLTVDASTSGAMVAAGGTIEVRLDSPAGELIGQASVAVAPPPPPRGRGAGPLAVQGGAAGQTRGGGAGRGAVVPPTEIALKPITGHHDLYLVFKNEQAAATAPLMTVSAIRVN